jgi:hypothetical protein
MKDKSLMIISIEAGKTVDKIQHHLMIKKKNSQHIRIISKNT